MTDKVSSEDFIKAFGNGVKDNREIIQISVFCENADEKAVADLKAELQSVIETRPQGEWIPVSERMPEEIINPVTNDFYEYICTFHLDYVDDVRVYKFGKGHWWLYGQMMDKYVTAWMPRPEPYTEKKITNFYTKRFNEVN